MIISHSRWKQFLKHASLFYSLHVFKAILPCEWVSCKAAYLKRNYPSWLQGQAVSRPKYLHIHVASGFNSKTTELSKNTAYCKMKLIIKCLTFGDEDYWLLISLPLPFILVDYILASSRWRVKLNFHFPAVNSDHSHSVGHLQPPGRDWTGAQSGTKTKQING